ncbi:MAG: ArnT family glycosyltransferase [Isosphaerales bacterium]
MTPKQHWWRLGLLMIGAAALLGWLTAHTEILSADGPRYIAQAKTIDQGAWTNGLVRSVDHPVYPLAISAVHRLIGGNRPDDWQKAAQLAAAFAGVLLAIPTYLIALELFGPSSAWLACLLIYLIPSNGHILADALSESTLLLFWSFAVWSSLRLLRTGRPAWLFLVVLSSLLAYLTRPEGLVVPGSLFATLILLRPLSSVLRPSESLGFPEPCRRWALGLLMVGSLIAAGPFMLMKGGISSKPAMSRLLGLTPRAGALAVERERPLDPEQTVPRTILLATRAMVRAVAGATTIPLLLLAPVGIAVGCSPAVARRSWLFLGIMLGASALALIRMHSLAGYCTPRHAMIVAWVLVLAGGAGLGRAVASLASTAARFLGDRWTIERVDAAVKAIALGGCVMAWGPAATAPIDSGFAGYRLAGEWLASTKGAGERVIDPKGLSLFYAGEPGYTFDTLTEGSHDRAVRWVIAHDSLLLGPWNYCELLRKLVDDRRSTRVFPVNRVRGSTQVYVFDLWRPEEKTAGSSLPQLRPRQ